jgi:hypothetical protein
MKCKCNMFIVVIITAIIAGGGVYLFMENNMVADEEVISDSSEIELPVVVYSRAGLLNTSEEGLAEKENLEEKLIEPYIDYNNTDDFHLVSMHITVPQNIGEEYEVFAIFASGVNHGFLFGSREGEYDYWKPDCMGECIYPEGFEEKYPQIVEQ